ncbi:hypothetical protein [Sphingobium aquiterrae]|uniref:hypothetical protein n=1 Tax=Sphingobium aquiterrae TaxID=2038656 RepID=UPI00301A96F2
MALKSIRAFSSFGLRAGSLGSRFVFTLFAAMWMTPTDFGIYGLVASASPIILQLVGLEAYQVTLRNISKSGMTPQAMADRAHYGRFIGLAACLAGLSGLAFALWFQWSLQLIALTAAVCIAEYVGTEATRILVSEQRPDSAMFSISLRYLPWNLGLPLLALANVIPRHWSAETVLLCWLVCSVAGSLFLLEVGGRYVARVDSAFRDWALALVRQVPRWVLIGISWRFLETGVRIVPGVMIDEKATGHFVFFATLASIGSTGLKAAIEPFWFVRMIRGESGRRARREYAGITVVWLLVAALLSAGIVYGSARFGGRAVTHGDIAIFALLVASCACLALSQIPHFTLYAMEADQLIERVSVLALIVGLIACPFGTYAFGLVGTAVGALIGSFVLLMGKALAAMALRESGQQGASTYAV